MVLYNFKTIAVVPTSKDFIDVTLSKTARKTPTIVHKNWKITRIRAFYARKIKYTQQNAHDKITLIIEAFPRLDDIHPFYADLINVLYSRDHYKLALGQVSTARNLIDNVGKDYLRLMKFADSMYRCKTLKKAALGRTCTIMKKLNASLSYLEQVRQHLSRLPSIDPNTRTLMITGYPNVGKSSFVNKLTRANVEVQPYAFTTKSLFVGHTDYKYLRWQVIDTPGILDHPLEDRNTIEMQAVTALAHLHSCVLFFVDISETCGYSLEKQVSLFHSIKALFSNKPLLVVANKTDLKKISSLTKAEKALLDTMTENDYCKILAMSNVSEEGIDTVKQTACDMLLEHRVERKLKGKRINDVVNRIHVALPTKRDKKKRDVSIPASVQAMMASDAPKVKRRTEKDIELENGGPGIYVADYKKHFLLQNDEWKYDVFPEIMDGKNVADFIDPDIAAKLDELEREEEELEALWEQQHMEADEESDLDDEQKELITKIRNKKGLMKAGRFINTTNNNPMVPRKNRVRNLEKMAGDLEELGLDTTKFRENSRARSKSRGRSTSKGRDDIDAMMEEETGRKRKRETSLARSASRNSRSVSRQPNDAPLEGEGFKDEEDKARARKLMKKSVQMSNMYAKSGEADHRVFDLKPKHLHTGKRGIGKTDRR